MHGIDVVKDLPANQVAIAGNGPLVVPGPRPERSGNQQEQKDDKSNFLHGKYLADNDSDVCSEMRWLG
jgi:hypothetical protein